MRWVVVPVAAEVVMLASGISAATAICQWALNVCV